VKEFNDGKTSAAVGQEWATSIRVPIIPDADEYTASLKEGAIYTIQVPDGKGGGFTLPFLPEDGRKIEAWMAKNCIAARGDQLIVHLEDQGCVRLGVRRGGH
jgi:hypothetical protein